MLLQRPEQDWVVAQRLFPGKVCFVLFAFMLPGSLGSCISKGSPMQALWSLSKSSESHRSLEKSVCTTVSQYTLLGPLTL